ncbi:MAG: hypothetical protein WCC06_06275 [Candidatus Aminicenantales bacterium]
MEKIVKKSAFLDAALTLGIVNLSALARLIKPEVEKEAMKKIQPGAVIVALNRLAQKIKKSTKLQKAVFRNTPDFIVRSSLVEMTYANSESLVLKQKKLLDQTNIRQNYFLTFTQGINETTLIAGKELKKKILAFFKEEKLISQIDNLSSVTILLPHGTALIPGVYSYILKALAWEGINVVEVVSTLNEFTIILEDKNIESSFAIIKRLY